MKAGNNLLTPMWKAKNNSNWKHFKKLKKMLHLEAMQQSSGIALNRQIMHDEARNVS